MARQIGQQGERPIRQVTLGIPTSETNIVSGLTGQPVSFQRYKTSGGFEEQGKSLSSSNLIISSDGFLRSGQTAYNTGIGWFLEGRGTPRFSIGNGPSGNRMTWDGTTLTVSGSLSASTIDIGGADATSFHVDIDGNMWLGAAVFNIATNPFAVSNAGVLRAVSGTIGGFTLGTTTLSATNLTLTSGAANTANISVGTGADLAGMNSGNAGTDIAFWAGDTFANRATADFTVTLAGAVTASSMTITGGSISGTPISGIPNSTATDISLLEMSHNLVFSVTDADTIAWAAGTIVMSNGRTFAINAGNTGNMAALTYIYLDTAVSTTVLQTTTTYSTAMGANRRLIGTAQNNTVTASFIPYGPGRPLVDGENIGALSIVAGNIAASTITAGKLSVSQLSAITADLGTITAGTVTGATIRTAASGTRFTMNSVSFQGINAAGNVTFEVVVDGTNAGDVIMGDDATGSYAQWDNSAGTFEVFADNVPVLSKGSFGGDGSDGALTITSGATNIDCSNAAILVRQYTSISITSTASLTFTNPHANGTLIILKSQGNVTITSTTNPAVDVRSMGAAGGTGGLDGNDGQSIFYRAVGGNRGAGNSGSTGGAGGAAVTQLGGIEASIGGGLARFWCGAGGGDGGKSGGDGGRGGGALIIECAGALNITSTLNAAGSAGTAGTANTGQAGGGGGSSGTLVIIYNTLTANSGTYTVSGGNGGNGGSSNSSDGGGGGASGGSGFTPDLGNGAAGGAGGNNANAGSDGSGAAGTGGAGGTGGTTNGTGGGGGGGGGGAEGMSYVVQNTQFA